MNLNVSPEKLRDFARYVGNFSRGIAEDCQQLATALNNLSSNLSAAERQSIVNMVKTIINILKEGQPTLSALKSEIESYADYVQTFQTMASN